MTSNSSTPHPDESAEQRAALITAYALDQLSPDERQQLEQAADFSPAEAERIRRLGGKIAAVERAGGRRSPELRQLLEARLHDSPTPKPITASGKRRLVIGAISLALLVAAITLGWRAKPSVSSNQPTKPVAQGEAIPSDEVSNDLDGEEPLSLIVSQTQTVHDRVALQPGDVVDLSKLPVRRRISGSDLFSRTESSSGQTQGEKEVSRLKQVNEGLIVASRESAQSGLRQELDRSVANLPAERAARRAALSELRSLPDGPNLRYWREQPTHRWESREQWGMKSGGYYPQYANTEGKPLTTNGESVNTKGTTVQLPAFNFQTGVFGLEVPQVGGFDAENAEFQIRGIDRETYSALTDNPFAPALGGEAISTFSIDVDTASYSNLRRMLRDGYLPPVDAVRVEEMINYFRYEYPQPEKDPLAVNLALAECPWAPGHQLLRVALKAKEIERSQRPPCNLVFLLDVSGSMNSPDKLPLLQESMKLLTAELDKDDRVTIVVYAGESGLHLATTSGDRQIDIRNAISVLGAGGSTNGEAGIRLAYEKAKENFIKEGVNRVIMATDGDLNVGITDDEELVQLIEKQAKSGVFLTVLGFGTGNLQDGKLEKLADHGNGVYAYIDSLREGRKVLVEQALSTLVTVAKDVKLQLEFNPRRVGEYRLIGYANRMLETKDFADDQKDAGDIGAGHTVTAFYELIPPGQAADSPPEPQIPLGDGEWKYQQPDGLQTEWKKAADSNDWATAALRFKLPDGEVSQRREFVIADEPVAFNAAGADFQFAAAVAAFGMQLRQSPYRGDASLAAVREIAAAALAGGAEGDRGEFLGLVERAMQLTSPLKK